MTSVSKAFELILKNYFRILTYLDSAEREFFSPLNQTEWKVPNPRLIERHLALNRRLVKNRKRIYHDKQLSKETETKSNTNHYGFACNLRRSD